MAKMLSQAKINKIHRLNREGWNTHAIARTTGHTWKTVDNALKKDSTLVEDTTQAEVEGTAISRVARCNLSDSDKLRIIALLDESIRG